MPQVVRRDYAWEPITLPQRSGNGLMKVEGYLTSSGVFEYEQPDGSKLREWRPPGEVSDATSIDSLKLSPVTIGHPAEQVSIDNIKELAVGTVGDDVRVETQWPDSELERTPGGANPNVKVRCRMVLTDAKAIKVIEDKEYPQVSCGYTADLDMTPGITPDGKTYDAVQRNIRHNHVAMGVIGRQGPGVSIRVDGHAVPRSDDQTDKQERPMKKLILDGVSYDAPEQTIEAVTANQAKAAKLLADAVEAVSAEKAANVELQKKLGEAEARADAASKSEKAAQAEAKAAQDKIRAGIKDRLALERQALKVLGDDQWAAGNLGDADDDDVRAAVIKHINPSRDLAAQITASKKGDAGASAYLRGLFEGAVESFADESDDDDDTETPAPEVKADGDAGNLRRRSATTVHVDAESATAKARADCIERRNNAHRPKQAN